ncbi:hypothetical protein TRFO_32765 [Tritrichomonas foetus]|uniref:Uncharacterized protein n=1 Tax=Tritrichomonas foetus TaxID=1144522 RepID=A0A1J4JMZ9_9EUKA|nr:hypothetical protein TRFO_32765 [Tritrichomonas foetus]|eukprot:OHT00497.1 hypothetical protein TRFO_32765 [Tritrichomonas foetus]
MILQHPRLTLFDEVSLFNFICSIYQINEHSKNGQSQNSKPTATLFEYVRFDNLTNESITKFISIFDIDDINSQIWSSICQRPISTSDLLFEGYELITDSRYIFSDCDFYNPGLFLVKNLTYV